MRVAKRRADNKAVRQGPRNSTRSTGKHTQPLSGCLSLDLEVQKSDSRIYALAGVRPDSGPSTIYPAGRQSLKQALDRLDTLADGADFLLGHNLIEFDLPHLRAVAPDLRLLRLPAVDTLRLNPLAFPRNPYHHLGQALPGRAAQARARKRSRTGRQAHSQVIHRPAEGPSRSARQICLTAWHWLTTMSEGSGFDRVFTSLRNLPRPSNAEAHAAILARLSEKSCQTHAAQIIAEMPRVRAGHWHTRWRGCPCPAVTR